MEGPRSNRIEGLINVRDQESYIDKLIEKDNERKKRLMVRSHGDMGKVSRLSVCIYIWIFVGFLGFKFDGFLFA